MALPNGPSSPFFLQTLRQIANPLEFLENCAQRYGDPFTLRGSKFPKVFFSDPQTLREIFTADPKQFRSEGSATLHPLLGEYSLPRLNGNTHHYQRRLQSPPYYGKRMETWGKCICEIAHQVIHQWTTGEALPIRLWMQEITLQIIIHTVFDVQNRGYYEHLKQLFSSLVYETLGSPLRVLSFRLFHHDFGTWTSWGRFLRLREKIDQLIYAEIQQRQEQPDSSRKDILTLLVDARDEAGQPMTQMEIRDQVITLLFSGHETTASALAWALYWIDQVAEVKQRLLHELDTLSDDAKPGAIIQLPYLTAVCEETLRISPVSTVAEPRVVASPMELMGYQLDAGTEIIPCIYLTHQRDDLYPEPKRFRPERFLERIFSAYEYLPFGGGNHRCIGSAFAPFEMKLILATILRHFDLQGTNRRMMRPVSRAVTLGPPPSMRMIATHRNK